MSAAGTASGPERRRCARAAMAPTGGPVAVIGARLVDVSPYGMMIESPVPMKEDAVLQFRLAVEGRKTDVSARVACCTARAGVRHAYGVGLEFVDLPSDVREQIRDLLHRHASAPPAR